MLRFLTAGESHGKALVVIVEGLPAGLPVTTAEIAGELARRRLGYGRGPRMRFEADEITLLGGIRHGRTLGSPVAIEIANTEWPKWEEEMSPDPGSPSKVLTKPRPGHADLAGMQKYGFDDARDVLERASARETAARVAAGKPGQGPAGPARRVGAEPRRRPRPGAGRGCGRARGPTTSNGSTSPPCGASTPTPRRGWCRPSRPPPRTATRSGAWSRSSPTACRWASAATCTGTAVSTASWPRRS